MHLSKKIASTLAVSALGISTLIAAPAASAANTSPATIFFVANVSGVNPNECDIATNQKFQAPLGTQVTDLFGRAGDQVTITNQCTKDIYIEYGQAGAVEKLDASSTGIYTLTSNAAQVQAQNSTGSALAIISVNAYDVLASGTNANTSLSVTSVAVAVGQNLRVANSGSSTLDVVNGTGDVRFGGQPCIGATCQISGGQIRFFQVASEGVISIGSASLTIGSGGGGDNGSSSSAAATPQTLELSITPTDGTTCANTSESGTQGTWIDLPAASDCTPPATTPNATLLGWATDPNFPVDIAQRQVDNGWGAYEMFNEDGQLTAVFIPAGMPTFLSAPGKIYPIWKM